MNFFNGYFVTYYVTEDFLNMMLKTVKRNVIFLPSQKNFLQVKPNSKIKIPIGLFSNEGFVLDCKWKPTQRIFNFPIEKLIDSNIILKPYQKEIVSSYFSITNKIGNKNKTPPYLTISSPCSTGKTIMAIDVITKIKEKTFIITKNIELAKQWQSQIEHFTEGITSYVSEKGVKNYMDTGKIYDILCFPSRHLESEIFCAFLSENYSFGIFDEGHLYNLETQNYLAYFLTNYAFSRILTLTATPRNYNSLFFGPVFDTRKILENFNIKANFTKQAFEISLDEEKYLPVPKTNYLTKYKSYNKRSHKHYLELDIIKKRALSTDHNRMQTILRTIVDDFQKNYDAKILLIVKFIEEIEFFSKILKEKCENVFPIIPSEELLLMDFRKKMQDLEQYIIIGTEKSLATGIDIPALNSLHLAFLSTNETTLIQAIGRVSRPNTSSFHRIFYYNISSYSELNIIPFIKTMRDVLVKENWPCFQIKG